MRLVSEAVVLKPEQIHHALGQAPGEALMDRVFLEEALPPAFEPRPRKRDSEAPSPFAWEVKDFSSNHCRVAVRCKEPCLLYYSDTFDKGWKAC
jgi:hypothetical protein